MCVLDLNVVCNAASVQMNMYYSIVQVSYKLYDCVHIETDCSVRLLT